MREAFLAFIAERPFKTRLTVTLAGHMVTGATAVDAMRTCLATAVAKETRRTDWEGIGETSGEQSGWENRHVVKGQTHETDTRGVFEYSLRWQVVPLNPGAHSQAPSSGEHDAPFLQLQDREQFGPQRPSAHMLSQWMPVRNTHTHMLTGCSHNTLRYVHNHMDIQTHVTHGHKNHRWPYLWYTDSENFTSFTAFKDYVLYDFVLRTIRCSQVHLPIQS